MNAPLLLVTVGLAFAGTAAATAELPAAIASTLGTTRVPPCAVCHFNGVTGAGTVTTAFGKSMRSRGLRPNDVASLNAALDRMAADRVDSDGDGVTDVDELKAGTDPNGGGAGFEPPVYGCGSASPAASPPPLAPAALAAFALRRRPRAKG